MPTFGKKGILLINLGTPDAPSRGAVYTYLKQFLTDGRVIDIPWLPRNLLVRGIIVPFRSGSSAKLYKKLWTEKGSPLKIYGERLAEGVQQHLGEEYEVELAMRYQNPSIESALNKLLAKQVSEIVVFPLFPHYASASTGSVHEEVMRLLSKRQVIPSLKLVNSYYDDPRLIDGFVENSKKFDLETYDHVLFSFHGIPQRHMRKADDCGHCLKVENCCNTISISNQFCYSAQCHATAQAIVEKLGLSKDQYTICYQSRLGNDPWMQPYTSDIIEERAKKGDKRMLVFCPAFVADCLETTIEILDEYKEEFIEKGGEHIDLVESLNDHPNWIKTVAEMVKEAAS
jgi:ferrochelatase